MITRSVSEMVECRPCVYERRARGEEGEGWELVDRRTFSEGRRRVRGYVRRRLGETVKEGGSDHLRRHGAAVVGDREDDAHSEQT